MRIFAIIAALLVGLPALAAAPAQKPAAPPAGKFYVVQPDGKSRPQDPIRDGVALGPDHRLSGLPHAERKATDSGSAAPVRGGNRTTVRITTSAAPPAPARDEFAAFRCEQAGLYYTNDGRCVAPITRRSARPQAPWRPAARPGT